MEGAGRAPARHAVGGAAGRYGRRGRGADHVDVSRQQRPYIGYGFARLGDGREVVWSFRFRYDRAFLEVGAPDPECDEIVGECELLASRDDVTGEPYEGWLPDAAAVRLLSELFLELAAPARGARFVERASNTVDLLNGAGDPAAPTLIRTLPATS